MKKIFHTYGNEFDNTSAEVIVPDLIEKFKPKSIMDVGCGVGNWLYVFNQFGVNQFYGIDGSHAKNQFLLDQSFFISTDFEKPKSFENLNLSRVDMAICLEVAEHLTEKTGLRLVDFLTSHTDIIIFSAAVPNQTGENHFNEQQPSYWQEKFKEKGFLFYDVFRSKYWTNPKVKWWYKQNMFLVVREGVIKDNQLPLFNGNLWIHPDLLAMHFHEIKELKKSFSAKLKKKVKSYLRR